MSRAQRGFLPGTCPGLADPVQVSDGSAFAWEDCFAIDVWYVDHASAALDLRIVLRTVGQVLRRDGIAADGRATAPIFLGANRATP